jgi:hypothetical protein
VEARGSFCPASPKLRNNFKFSWLFYGHPAMSLEKTVDEMTSTHAEGAGSQRRAPVPLLQCEKTLLDDVQGAINIEHNLTLLQAIKIYRKAIFWCLLISTCVIMEGYDQILVQSFYAYPQFQIKYGEYVGRGPTGYQLSAAWQAGLTDASGVGAFFGAFIKKEDIRTQKIRCRTQFSD